MNRLASAINFEHEVIWDRFRFERERTIGEESLPADLEIQRILPVEVLNRDLKVTRGPKRLHDKVGDRVGELLPADADFLEGVLRVGTNVGPRRSPSHRASTSSRPMRSKSIPTPAGAT